MITKEDLLTNKKWYSAQDKCQIRYFGISVEYEQSKLILKLEGIQYLQLPISDHHTVEDVTTIAEALIEMLDKLDFDLSSRYKS